MEHEHHIVRPDPLRPDLNYLVHLQRPAASLRLCGGYPRALMAGGHLSRFQGRGMEFDEVRPYQPGDDIRNMDWRVTARTGKPHTKLFREERERPALLLLDLRPAMFFATRGALKAVVAAECAALLAWRVVHQGDRIGGMLLHANRSAQKTVLQRPMRGKRAVMRLLGQIVSDDGWQQRLADDGASLFPSIQRAAHATPTGSMMLMVSDARGLDDEAAMLLQQQLHHHTIVFVLIFDPFEAHIADVGQLQAFDGAAVRTINTSDGAMRRQFVEQYAERRQRLEKLAAMPGFFLITCATTDDPFTVLQAGLGGAR